MKVKIKKNLVKRFNSIMIAFAILNLIGILFGQKSYAAISFPLAAADGVLALLSISMAGIPLIIINVIKLVIIIIGFVLQSIISGAYSSLEGSLEWAGLSDIIFAGSDNASRFLDVNFFDLSSGTNALITFRTAIAKWYYILRLISAAILLVILIYVGIRMAISTIASEQAKYKQMLTDWLVSLALLFLLHYIIIFIIQVNSSLVKALGSILGNKDCTGSMMAEVAGNMLLPGIVGIFSAIIYAVFVGQIFSFFLLYIKRMITVGFLIMIAPLITITYSIDKMGDGKAQALNAWLKELTYNILIQPFHCVIFLSFFDAMAKIISNQTYTIGAYVFAIVVMQFVKKAEDTLRKIFHFQANSMSSLKESGQSIGNATGTFVKTSMKVGGAIATFQAAGGMKAVKQSWKKYEADRRDNRELKKSFNQQKQEGTLSSDTTFEDYKQSDEGKAELAKIQQINAAEMKAKADQERNRKIDKIRRIYNKKHDGDDYDTMIEDKARKAYDKANGAGAYDHMKNMASKVDKYGRPTKTAQKAQSILDAENAKAHNAFINEGGAGIKRSLKNGWANTGGRVYKNMRKFANSDYGKVLGAAIKDSTRVAAAIGMGAFGYGMDDFSDAMSIGQVGYGLATGFLKNSTRTLVKDSTEKTQQIATLMGQDPSDLTVVQNILAQIKAEKQAGALDPKAITAKLDQLENTITSLYSDRTKGHLDFTQFRAELQAAAISGKLNATQMERLIEQQFANFDNNDKENIKASATNYINTVLMAGVATNQTTLEKAGLDVDEHDTKVVNRAEKTTFSV